jgi:hypothetical protein
VRTAEILSMAAPMDLTVTNFERAFPVDIHDSRTGASRLSISSFKRRNRRQMAIGRKGEAPTRHEFDGSGRNRHDQECL